MEFEFYFINIVLIGVIILPNLLFVFFPPKDSPGRENKRTVFWKSITVIENIGRIGVFILPLFWEIHFDENFIILIFMVLFVLIYYATWLRYIIKGRRYISLFEPIYFIPVPMAIFPSLYFILTGILLNSYLIIIFSIIFAFSHIMESLRNYSLAKA